MSDENNLVGQTIGNYRVLRKLGQGGMGAVYLGENPDIRSRVAIKVLLPAMVARPDMVHRFLDEARAVNLIGHPGIVRIHDSGRREGVGIYMIMEYLEGRSLEEMIQDGHPFNPVEVAQIKRPTGTTTRAASATLLRRMAKPRRAPSTVLTIANSTWKKMGKYP